MWEGEINPGKSVFGKKLQKELKEHYSPTCNMSIEKVKHIWHSTLVTLNKQLYLHNKNTYVMRYVFWLLQYQNKDRSWTSVSTFVCNTLLLLCK